jgi:formamidopyrimidine-DNA glycosylase
VPELPDVEGFKRLLTKSALRKTIARVVVGDARILSRLSARRFAARLRGARLVEVYRHGKYLMARLDRGGWLTLHFGMTGALQPVGKSGGEPPFTRVRLDFAGDGSLAYINKRMIGRVGLTDDAADFIAAESLGPDALGFGFEAFGAALRGCRSSLRIFRMGSRTAYCCPRCQANE